MCPECALGTACKVDADCNVGGCDTISHVCVDRCADHHQESNEQVIDCGGGCPLGNACKLDNDCASQVCDAVSYACTTDPCTDNRADGQETDVDCGGANACPRCTVGEKCNASSDCTAGLACSGDAQIHVCY